MQARSAYHVLVRSANDMSLACGGGKAKQPRSLYGMKSGPSAFLC